MMNADKQVLYSGVPQEDWQNKSKYPRIMSNGPKPPKTNEKCRKTSGLIPFLILTGVTLLISAAVVIGLHYIKYTEQDGLVFNTGESYKTSEESSHSGPEDLGPKPIPVDNKNPAESENPTMPQNPNDKASDQGKEASPKPEPSGKDVNAQVNLPKPDSGKELIPNTDEANKKQEVNSNPNIDSEKIKDEISAETEIQQQQQQQTSEGKDITDYNKKVPDETTADDGKQNSDVPTNDQDNITDDDEDDDDDWFDIIKTDDKIIFQKPTTPKPKEVKEADTENQPTKNEEKKEEKENDKKEENGKDEEEEKGEMEEKVGKDLDKKDKDISPSKEKEEHEEDNKKEEEKEAKKKDKDHEDTSLLYKAIDNFAQKYFNSTNLNPSQVKDMLQNLSVGPSIEVIIIAAGIIFIGLSLLIIAITCLVTRTRKVRIRREKIKKAVSDLEGAEKVILLTDEQSEDEYVKA